MIIDACIFCFCVYFISLILISLLSMLCPFILITYLYCFMLVLMCMIYFVNIVLFFYWCHNHVSKIFFCSCHYSRMLFSCKHLCCDVVIHILLFTNIFCLSNLQKIAKRKFATNSICHVITYFGMNEIIFVFMLFTSMHVLNFMF